MRRPTPSRLISYAFLLLTLIGASPFAVSERANAADPTSWIAGNIVDDAIFTQNDSMSVAEIQAFLNSKMPACDTWGTKASEYGGGTRAQYAASRGQPAPFTCLKDYREVPKTTPGGGVPNNNYGAVSGNSPAGSKSAAEIIWQAAHDFNISAKVLLVTLQKESGLITDEWPFKRQLVYAMGAHCPDSGPGGSANCDPNYGGFSLQIRESADLLRYYLDNMQQPWWTNKRPYQSNLIRYDVEESCGGSNIYLENKATTALYVYTPYQPTQAALAAGYGSAEPCGAYGNRNFWLYYKDWFGPTRGTFLLQSPASPAVYLQSGSTRYGIPSQSVINAYGLSGIKVTPVSDQYMNSLVDGGVLGTTFKKEGSDAIYFADNGYRFGFATYGQCVNWGFPNCLTSASKSITPPIFDRLYDAGAMKSLMLTGSTVFLMDNGEKRPFLSGKAMTESGFTSNDIVPVTSPVNNSQPLGFALLENNSFIKFSPRATIYYYNDGKFYPLTYGAFSSLAANRTVFEDGYSKYITTPPTAEYTVSPYVRLSTGKRYLLTNGGKIDITATNSHWPAQQLADELQAAIDTQPVSATTSASSTYRSVAGAIFAVEAQQLRPFYSLNDYFALGHTTPITVGNEVLSSLDQGPYILGAGAGSLYQVKTAGKEYAIYALSSDNSICQITSLSQLGDLRFDASAVKRIDEPGGTVRNLTNLITDPSGNVQLIEGGKRTLMAKANLLNYWGISSYTPGCTFSERFISGIPASTQNFSRFMRSNSGIIYYGEGGKKRPIYSYNAFLRLGGNSNNTPTVPEDLLSLSPTGEPITQ